MVYFTTTNMHKYILIVTLFLRNVECINITELAFGSSSEYRPVAFGDFNSDKLTDIFVLENLKPEGMTLHVLISSNEPPLLQNTGIYCSFPKLKIKSVVPGDFDGDGAMDVLIVTLPGNGKYEAHVLWGDLKKLDCNATDFAIKFSSQPLLLDYNGDMIADLFGDDEYGNWTVWLFNNQRSPPDSHTINTNGPPLRKPSSHAFVDLDQDLSADVWIGTVSHFEIRNPTVSELVLWKKVPFPKINGKEPALIGQSSFGDIDLDGDIEVILPVCADKKCSDGRIFVYDIERKDWFDLNVSLKEGDNEMWSFPDTTTIMYLYMDTITLRVGDYNLDGYPDILITLLDPSRQPHVVLLENAPCSEKCEYSRTLVPQWDLLEEWKGSVLGTFFDFEEDGYLDIILVQSMEDKKYTMGAFKNSKEYDAMFVKVLVATGRCLDDCAHHSLPYGTNQPGPAIQYAITTASGDTQHSRATQMSQSAHMVMQLPYTVFGLGRNWNFVETLQVGIPKILNTSHYQDHTSTFTQIIPNSQVIVIPNPPTKPHLWVNKLFITPSKALKMTAGALIATCLFVAAIIGVLHYRERQQDKREKLQESQRFHFDAM